MAKVISGDRRYDGPMGKSDRAFLISIYGLLSYFWMGFTPYGSYLFLIAIPLLILSTYTRLSKSLNH